ncbi:hypothetical protein D3C75_1033570 [compost metagenome]
MSGNVKDVEVRIGLAFCVSAEKALEFPNAQQMQHLLQLSSESREAITVSLGR